MIRKLSSVNNKYQFLGGGVPGGGQFTQTGGLHPTGGQVPGGQYPGVPQLPAGGTYTGGVVFQVPSGGVQGITGELSRLLIG